VIHSYHADNGWDVAIMDGIEKLFSDRHADVTVMADYLDAMRFPGKDTLPKARELAETKMRLFAPWLIIACDNAALDFVLECRPRGFSSVPVVFCAINGFQPSMLQGQTGITGVGEDISVGDTMLMALKLHPGTRRIVVINRTDTQVARISRQAVEDALPVIDPSVEVERWEDLPMTALSDRLKKLRRGTIVFLNALVLDGSGKDLTFAETTEFARSLTDVPLYSFWDVFLEHGIVGGKMTSGPKQGEIAAGLALRILAGEKPEDIPVVSAQEANRFTFDMREVRRFGIARSALPADSLLLHDPVSPFHTYRWVFGGIFLFVLIQSAVILVLVMNVQWRHKAQKKLKEEQSQLALALDGANLGMWDWDIPARRVRFDERLSSMLGYPPGDRVLDPSDIVPIVHADDLARVRENIESRLAVGSPPIESEYRIRRTSGSWLWIWQRGLVATRDAAGNPLRVYGTILDVSGRKLAEEQRLDMERRLLHSQKLESLGVLAGGIAHDFNNLLSVILGNMDLARGDLPADCPSRPHLDAAITAADRAADLTRQMLAYSGKGRFIVRELDVSALVDEIAHLLRTSVPKTISLSLQLARGLPAVLADSVQVQQVIMNLITNASEAIGDRAGTVRISTGFQDCDAEYLSRSRLERKPQPGRYVWIEVSDDGCGMSAAVQARLFEPFFTSKATGRGLGMSAVLGILHGHGGAIVVYSEEGAGTTIKALLPVPQTAGNGRIAPDGPVERTAAETAPLAGLVLVVDDEEAVRKMAQKMLERMGLRVLGVADGLEALEAFRARPDDFAFVLLDLTMPKMDGAALFAEMKRIRPDVKIILSSGYNQQSVTQRFAGKGLTGFVQKPYMMRALEEEVRRVLAGRPSPWQTPD